jgi:uncharacterized protein (TIGR00375 family)
MNLEGMAEAARWKGIKVLGTGDFTHPKWFLQLKEHLQQVEEGVFEFMGTFFLLTTEVSNIFTQGGRQRRVHNIIFSPSFSVCEKINKELLKYGDLEVDGRPTLSLSCTQLVESVLSCSQECLIVPAHIWTPWYSLFGANSGFDDIHECFQDYTSYIHCLETGLSSDPKMNWRLSALDNFTLISNSDAHSPSKIGREANVFDLEPPITYKKMVEAMKNKDKSSFLYTVEFFPEEGKYHYDGHRRCNVRLSPTEAKKGGNLCPVCAKPLTIGVMHRVENLSDREEGFVPEGAVPFRYAIPLLELIAWVQGQSTPSSSAEREYKRLVQQKEEFALLLYEEREGLMRICPSSLVNAIISVREGRVKIEPGFDGVFGKIEVLKEDVQEEQLSLF